MKIELNDGKIMPEVRQMFAAWDGSVPVIISAAAGKGKVLHTNAISAGYSKARNINYYVFMMFTSLSKLEDFVDQNDDLITHVHLDGKTSHC